MHITKPLFSDLNYKNKSKSTISADTNNSSTTSNIIIDNTLNDDDKNYVKNLTLFKNKTKPLIIEPTITEEDIDNIDNDDYDYDNDKILEINKFFENILRIPYNLFSIEERKVIYKIANFGGDCFKTIIACFSMGKDSKRKSNILHSKILCTNSIHHDTFFGIKPQYEYEMNFLETTFINVIFVYFNLDTSYQKFVNLDASHKVNVIHINIYQLFYTNDPLTHYYSNSLKNSVFIFIDLNWDIIRLFLYMKEYKVIGSYTRRTYLASMLDARFITFIKILNISYHDIRESFNNSHKKSKFDDSNYNFANLLKIVKNTSIKERNYEYLLKKKENGSSRSYHTMCNNNCVAYFNKNFLKNLTLFTNNYKLKYTTKSIKNIYHINNFSIYKAFLANLNINNIKQINSTQLNKIEVSDNSTELTEYLYLDNKYKNMSINELWSYQVKTEKEFESIFFFLLRNNYISGNDYNFDLYDECIKTKNYSLEVFKSEGDFSIPLSENMFNLKLTLEKKAMDLNPYDKYKLWYYKNTGKNLSYKQYIKSFESEFKTYKQYIKNFNLKLNNKTWQSFSYKINKSILNKTIINLSVNSFWKTINENKIEKFGVFFKVFYVDGYIRSIGTLQISSSSELDKSTYKDRILFLWDKKPIWYKEKKLESILFLYKKLPNSTLTNFINPVYEDKAINYEFKGYELPNTADISLWGNGNVRFNEDYQSAFLIEKYNRKTYEYLIYIFENYIKVKIFFKNSDKPLLTFEDYVYDNYDLSTFKRTIDNVEYHFKNGVLLYKTIKRKVKYLSKLLPAPKLHFNIISMDIETKNVKGNLVPICLCINDGINETYFSIDEYNNNSIEMVKAAISSIMIRKYYGSRVYFHNFSYFDGIFIFNILSELGEIKNPIIRDGRLITIPLNFGKKGILYFHDSYLLLPAKLSDLGISFNVEDKKLIFPILFVNEFELDYIGAVPDYKYFVDVEYSQYLNYKTKFLNKSWILKDELINYCKGDSKSLYQILKKYYEIIFKIGKIDVSKYPTLASIAFGIYRTMYMISDGSKKIPLIVGEIYNDIRESYTGGFVDVYKPYSDNAYSYDIVSLYPSTMKYCPMPVGDPTFIEGNNLDINTLFGFFFVEVEAPENLKIPILQTKLKNSTITPVGSWTGWYFSEELKNALIYGYKIKVLKGWIFEKDYIFGEYVDELFKLKNSVSKNNPLYTIAKLLLNSLYGRFGMNPDALNHTVLKKNDNLDFYLKHDIHDVIVLKNGLELVSFKFKDSNLNDSLYSKKTNISIAIASAITSYSRIKMSYYLDKYNSSLLTIDTDGIKTSDILCEKDIGLGLGDMKYEYKFKEFTALAPKVYGGILEDGKELVKVKGLKNPISYSNLKSLLYKDSKLKIPQDKWYRHLDEGYINIKEEIYTLMITENKRNNIYNNLGKFIDTKPFELINGKLSNKIKINNLYIIQMWIEYDLFKINENLEIISNELYNKPLSLIIYKFKGDYFDNLENYIPNNYILNKLKSEYNTPIENIKINYVDNFISTHKINSVQENLFYKNFNNFIFKLRDITTNYALKFTILLKNYLVNELKLFYFEIIKCCIIIFVLFLIFTLSINGFSFLIPSILKRLLRLKYKNYLVSSFIINNSKSGLINKISNQSKVNSQSYYLPLYSVKNPKLINMFDYKIYYFNKFKERIWSENQKLIEAEEAVMYFENNVRVLQEELMNHINIIENILSCNVV